MTTVMDELLDKLSDALTSERLAAEALAFAPEDPEAVASHEESQVEVDRILRELLDYTPAAQDKLRPSACRS